MRNSIIHRLNPGKFFWAAIAGVAIGLVIKDRFPPGRDQANLRLDGRHDAPTPGLRVAEGGMAYNPAEIPARGWWNVIMRTYHEIGNDRVLAVAAGVAFYGLLALFPAITAFVSLYGLVADYNSVSNHLSLLDGILPTDAVGFIRGQVMRITGGYEGKLGIALLISIALSLWSANAGVKAIFDALNVAYNETEKRSFITLNAVSLIFTFGMIVFVLLAIGAIAVAPAVLNYIYLGPAAEWLIWLGRWPAIFIVLILALALLYRFGPSRNDARWSWVSPGAIFAAITWVGFSIIFSWYVANFGDYNKTYGTLGAVIVLLMWMWLSIAIILIGGELNSEAERQTWRDTTVGAPKPLGMRGAEVADNKDANRSG